MFFLKALTGVAKQRPCEWKLGGFLHLSFPKNLHTDPSVHSSKRSYHDSVTFRSLPLLLHPLTPILNSQSPPFSLSSTTHAKATIIPPTPLPLRMGKAQPSRITYPLFLSASFKVPQIFGCETLYH